MDPNSGSAVLAEVARAMMQTVNETGWRPARTIMFANWDAEEHGIIGSTEFVEEFTDILRQRAVVYLNMDTIHGNMTLHVGTIPSLYRVIVEAAKRVENPSKSEKAKGRTTVYDTWLRLRPSHTPGLPQIPVPGGGSDHAAFLTYAGIPVVDFSYKNATIHDTYPLYHTMYETPFVNEHLLDTDNFAVHRAIGQFWAELARFFTDEAVLPFNTTELAVAIVKDYIPALGKALTPLKYYQKAIEPAVEQLSHFTKAAQEFLNMCRNKRESYPGLQTRRALYAARQAYSSRAKRAITCATVSSLYILFFSAQRCFINPRGSPTAPQSRHVLYSISEHDSYASRQMAAVYDA
ncbi:unnamed protein product, partial [Cylicostephanus goldi]